MTLPNRSRRTPPSGSGARVGGGWLHDLMGVDSGDFLRLVTQLEDVEPVDHGRYTQFLVHGHGFGYLWVPTQTVGLKQPLSEQIALVAERPDVFEVQFTAGSFGWVVVHLARIERDELAELTYEAWRLTAPASLVEERGARLPS
jgi:hypothetical protein